MSALHSIAASTNRFASWPSFLLLLYLLPLSLTAATPERISVTYSVDSIPFQYTDDNGDPNGIIIDYWKLWSEKTGIGVDFIEATWNQTLALVRDGKVDAHAGLFFNEERDKFLDYGTPLTKSDTHVFFHNSIEPTNDLGSLAAYRIGVLGKDFVEGHLKQRVAPESIVGFPDYSEIMEQLRSGRLKVFAADTPTGLFHLAQAGLLAKFHHDYSAPLYQNDWLVASGEGNTEMLALINEGMAMISPEERKRIERRWVSGMPGEASDAIIIAISSNYAPFSTIGVDGKPGGYLVDLWREWGRQVGKDVEFRATSWTDTLGGIKSGEADIHSGLFKSRERTEWFAFSDPFIRIETAVYFKSGEVVSDSFEELPSPGVGAIRDSFQSEYLKTRHPGIQQVHFADIDDLLTGLLLGNIGAAVAEVPEMSSALSRLGISGAAQQGETLFTENVHAAVLKDNTSLLALTNQGLSAIPPKTLAAIEDRWISHGLNWKNVMVWVAPFIGGFIMIIIAITVWNRRLGHEVEERKRMELALIEAKETADAANRAKSAFLANMSHELRTPMNAILGYSEMLTEDAEDLGQQEFIPDLRKISKAGTHLLALINDVLDLSKIESGKMETYAEDIDVGCLVEEVTATAQPLLNKNANSLVIERSDHLGTAHQDLTKLRQSLFNLLSNAAKFTHEGKIILNASRAAENGMDWLTFSVTDTGIGIPADKIDHVFEEFSQADESTTRNYGGTGLGLAISRRFCRLLGGDLTVKSRPGTGSTFTIRLPATLPGTSTSKSHVETIPADKQARSGTAMQVKPGTTVLVIDDDTQSLDIIKRSLEKDGIAVITASNGEEGLRLAHEIQPAAITLDIMMPDMDGWSVLRALKADPRLCKIPVIVLTMVDDKSSGYSLGAADYLTKPIDREQLLNTISGFRVSGRTGPVMLVEDDFATREVTTRMLLKNDWEVVEASNGREALHMLHDIRPALIMLDLMMPVMDGFDFLVELRAHAEWQDIPVIVVTAKDLTEEDLQLLSGRVEQVLEKSALSREQLMQQVRDAISPT